MVGGRNLTGAALAAASLLCLSACERAPGLKQPKRMERLGRYSSAIGQYEKFVARHPRHPLSAEALFRTGEIYRTTIKDYERAKSYYQKILKRYPESGWTQRAKSAIMNSPDFFPLDERRLQVLGDSESGGENMRTEISVLPGKGGGADARVIREIYAGKERVGRQELRFEKKDMELREYRPDGPAYSVILKFPARKGLRWETLRGKELSTFSVEEDDVPVRIGTHTFLNCLKVREQPARAESTWRYHYYAPFVGLILTSHATASRETRIVELLRWEEGNVSRDRAPAKRPFARLRSWAAKLMRS